jgi:hypothetical protein
MSMELKIDSIRKKKKIFYLTLGIVYLLLTGARIIVDYFGYNTLDWIHFSLFAFFGIFFLYLGLAKTYILIDSECISQKTPIFEKSHFVTWDEIKSINYNLYLDGFEIRKVDNTIFTLYFDDFNSTSVNKIKETIISNAKEKDILIIA